MRAKDIDRATAVADKAELYYIAHLTYSASHKSFRGAATETIGPLRHMDRPSSAKVCKTASEVLALPSTGRYTLLTLNIWRRCAPDGQLIASLRAPVEASFHRAA
jgi:hypothetical protein